MHFILLFLILILLLFGPQYWARYTFRKYATQLDRIEGTGGELARHLLDRFDMENVGVEKTQPGGDHYDPETRMVRLSPDNYDQKSLTAVAVAAHEVGHAIQHHRNESKLALRTRLINATQKAQKFGAGAMLIFPMVMVVTRAPSAGFLMLLIGLISMCSAALVHLVTLPVELDASFGKAMPILKKGYISKQDEAAVNQVLKAAAWTYVAASLASLLNIGRWIALLRR
ncbi:MAG: zinc metallopeptidase [Gammaproteobacteria bacterium]